MASATAVWALPYPVMGDDANMLQAVKPLADRLEILLSQVAAAAANGSFEQIPIGVVLGYAGATLPTGGKWDWADGALISRVTYVDFFNRVGHAYNGGLDPGSSQVRKPDKRGRAIVGADNFGQGAANRLPNSNRLRGQNGGVERYTLTKADIPIAVPATLSGNSNALGSYAIGQPQPSSINVPGLVTGIDSWGQGGGGPHSLLQPYECDNAIVRIA